MDAVEARIFQYRLQGICEEMGARLMRAAISPNIRDRLDFSCAIFDATGLLIAQAAHIPVHLGSMAFAMQDIAQRFDWQEGDVVVFNDPFAGGTHLPDITLVAPIFARGVLVGFAAARAHHADVGGVHPASMGRARTLDEEGVVIPPMHWFRKGHEDPALFRLLGARIRTLAERRADLKAQRAAVMSACARLAEADPEELGARMQALALLAEGYGRATIEAIPDGEYALADVLDDDGFGARDLAIRVVITVKGAHAHVDFTGTAPPAAGPVNCPLSVTHAAVWYAFRCLMPAHTPTAARVFRPITIEAPSPSLVHAPRGAPVAAGNVETSQRIVDVVLGALAKALPARIPAASQGTMNNIAFAGEGFSHYETLAGGAGASPEGDGAGPIQCHMTNTRLASAEILEMYAPLRVVRTEIRRGSGGKGKHTGGPGMVRAWQALAPCRVAILAERRRHAPWGLAGGGEGARGAQRLIRADGTDEPLAGKDEAELAPGDVVIVETPGGGGWGAP